MPEQYQPPFSITPLIVNLVADISVAVSGVSVETLRSNPRLRKINRIRTIRGSLAIEGNTLTEEQITAILEGKRVIAPSREIKEAQGAIRAYDHLDRWKPHRLTIIQRHIVQRGSARQADPASRPSKSPSKLSNCCKS